MLYALISGGALAVAIIPVLSEVITKENRENAWKVFSQIANFAFLITALLSVLVATFAWPLVQHPLGIAPGFTYEQQAMVVHLMRPEPDCYAYLFHGGFVDRRAASQPAFSAACRSGRSSTNVGPDLRRAGAFSYR